MRNDNDRDIVQNISDAAGMEMFDFDEWRDLYERDPQAFEQRRAEVIEAAIMAAPESFRTRLRGLMFEIDGRRARARTPMDACMQISNMMWDKFEDLRVHLSAIAAPEQLSDAERRSLEKKPSKAQVLQFRR